MKRFFQRRMAQTEDSIEGYLRAMDTADRAEPDVAKLKKGRPKERSRLYGNGCNS